MDKRKDEKVNKDKSNIEKAKEEGKQINQFIIGFFL